MNDELHPEQIKALRKMTPAQRLTIGLQFVEEMRQLKARRRFGHDIRGGLRNKSRTLCESSCGMALPKVAALIAERLNAIPRYKRRRYRPGSRRKRHRQIDRSLSSRAVLLPAG